MGGPPLPERVRSCDTVCRRERLPRREGVRKRARGYITYGKDGSGASELPFGCDFRFKAYRSQGLLECGVGLALIKGDLFTEPAKCRGIVGRLK